MLGSRGEQEAELEVEKFAKTPIVQHIMAEATDVLKKSPVFISTQEMPPAIAEAMLEGIKKALIANSAFYKKIIDEGPEKALGEDVFHEMASELYDGFRSSKLA